MADKLALRIDSAIQPVITADTTISDYDDRSPIPINATSGNITITLPTPTTANAGRRLEFIRIDNSVNIVRIITQNISSVFSALIGGPILIEMKTGGRIEIISIASNHVLKDISGVSKTQRLWLPSDASTSPVVWYSFNDLANLTHAAGRVSAMTNKGTGGAGYNLVQATGTSQPLLDSTTTPTKAAFDGGDFLKNAVAQAFFAASTTITYALMYKQAGNATTVPFGSENGTNRIQCHPQWSDGVTYVDMGSVAGGRISANLGGIASGVNPHTLVATRSAANGNVYIDGNPTANITNGSLSGSQAGTSLISIGAQANDNSNPLTGDIYECLGYNIALTNDEKDRLAAYLHWKAGQQAQIHASNSYKTLPPLSQVTIF